MFDRPLLLLLLFASTPAFAIDLEPCELSSAGLPYRVKARCGRLEVPENPGVPDGKRIALRIALLPATGRDPAPDPIFFLAGGPGQAATEAFVAVSGAFERANRARDVVLVDQRGTGGSNRLACASGEELEALPTEQELIAETKRCLERLEGDPRFYTTSIAMEDLDQVRDALGYARINLVGVSYGTRAALTYLRRHRDRVRTLVLDGVVSSELALGFTHAKNLERALGLQFERCASDPVCKERFGDVREKLAALVKQVEAASVRVTIPDPRTGEPRDLEMDRSMLALGIRLLAYAPETAALLPLLIHEAHDEKRFDRLAAQSAMVARSLGTAISRGMELSVLCAEDAPFYEMDRHEGAGTLLGDQLVKLVRTQCSVWPAGEAPADFHAPVESDVPALLLSGELDPVTPPEEAERVKAHLENSLHLVLEGQGHNVIARGCMPRLLSRFFETASTNLETECLERLAAAPFFTSLTGPEP